MDSTEFQSWKVNFKTEICAKTANPQITMHWITDVEKAQSIDELMTSQSILGRKDLPAYEMLDVVIASSLKKASPLAYSLPEKILARKTDCAHDLRAFSCNWCL